MRLLSRNERDWTAKFPAVAEGVARLPVADGDARRRGGRLPARRHDQLPGAPERGVRRRHGRSAHLHGLRPPAPRRLGPDRRAASRTGRRCSRALLERRRRPRAAQVQRPRGRRRPRVLRAGVPAGPRGHRLEAARRALPRRPDAGLAQDQVRPRAGGRDRRLHRARGLARRHRRACWPGSTRTGGCVFAGKVGTGFSDKTLRDLHKRLRALEQDACPFTPPPTGLGRAALGEALAGRAGDVRRVDGRRPDAASRRSRGSARTSRAEEVVREMPTPDRGSPSPPQRSARRSGPPRERPAAGAAADAATRWPRSRACGSPMPTASSTRRRA